MDKALRAAGWIGLVVGVLALYPMGLFGTADHVWKWMGAPPEIYPEWGYLLYGIPAALLAIMSGAPLAMAHRHGGRASWPHWVALVISMLSVSLCLYLLGFAAWAYAT